jgi:hypothetical protein
MVQMQMRDLHNFTNILIRVAILLLKHQVNICVLSMEFPLHNLCVSTGYFHLLQNSQIIPKVKQKWPFSQFGDAIDMKCNENNAAVLSCSLWLHWIT